VSTASFRSNLNITSGSRVAYIALEVNKKDPPDGGLNGLDDWRRSILNSSFSTGINRYD